MNFIGIGTRGLSGRFRKTARLTAHHPLKPKVDLYTRNTEKSSFAEQAQQMDFSEFDRAPEDELNRILWYVTKVPTCRIRRRSIAPCSRAVTNEESP